MTEEYLVVIAYVVELQQLHTGMLDECLTGREKRVESQAVTGLVTSGLFCSTLVFAHAGPLVPFVFEHPVVHDFARALNLIVSQGLCLLYKYEPC
jgi:hypothetical protein